MTMPKELIPPLELKGGPDWTDYYYTIRLGGEDLKMRYNWRALDRIQKEIGADLLATMFRDRNHRAIAKAVAIGLAKHHPEWTEDRVFDESPAVGPTMAIVDAGLALALHGREVPVAEPAGHGFALGRLIGMWRKPATA
jgi:hypothetical protein